MEEDSLSHEHDGFDSVSFERAVFDAFLAAVERFNVEVAPRGDRVFQVAIWTDVEAGASAVSFETKPNSESMIRASADFWRLNGDEETAHEIESSPYHGNPEDFKYSRFVMAEHAYMSAMSQQADATAELARLVEASLLRVVDRILASHVLDEIPLERPAWIGTSSPIDWYDHVQRLA